MTQPTLQLPVKVERIIDGDTVEVSLKFNAHIRLLDCWAPEMRDHGGEESRVHLQELSLYRDAILEIPFTPGCGPGQIFSFERVLGRLLVDGQDLSQAQCAAGHATMEKR